MSHRKPRSWVLEWLSLLMDEFYLASYTELHCVWGLRDLRSLLTAGTWTVGGLLSNRDLKRLMDLFEGLGP